MEYVKTEAKVVYILECLQKTPPPVLVFAEKKQDVDGIHEYLLLKGVEAVAIHGGKGLLINYYYFYYLQFHIAIYVCFLLSRPRRKIKRR